MCFKMSKIWCACPVSLSSCCSLAHSTLPATMKSHFLIPSYPTPLTEIQKNKLWYTAKASERIVWVPGQQSRLWVSFQFKASFFICFLPRDGLENLKQCEQSEMEARSQGVVLSLTTGRKQECCWMETGAWWYSCTFMFLSIQKIRNPEKNLHIPYLLPGHGPSHCRLTEQECVRPWRTFPAISLQLWRTSLPERTDR